MRLRVWTGPSDQINNTTKFGISDINNGRTTEFTKKDVGFCINCDYYIQV